jgi:hypothetical protein
LVQTGPTSGPAAAEFISPANTVTLVKAATFTNLGTASQNVSLQLRAANGSVVVILFTTALAANATDTWSGWHVLNPGDFVYVSLGGPTLYAWVSGAVLGGGNQFPPGT